MNIRSIVIICMGEPLTGNYPLINSHFSGNFATIKLWMSTTARDFFLIQQFNSFSWGVEYWE